MLSRLIRKILQNLSFFYTNDMRIPKIRDRRIYKELNKYLKKKFKDHKNLKVTHNKFNYNLYKIIKDGKLYNFLRNSFIQKMFFVHNRFFIFKELNVLRNSQKWMFYKNLLVEDKVGNPVKYFLYPDSSGNRINHVYHLSVLEKYLNLNLKDINYILEFGGGYGCMARIFFKINRKIKYLIFDTKLVNLLQYYYLKQNLMKVGFSKNDQFELINEYKKLHSENKKNSLFIANWSLSETPIFFRKKFLKNINNYHYFFIAFQEYFEEINNKKYFNQLEKKLKKNYDLNLIQNQFYEGNIFKKQKHFFLIGQKR